MSNLLSVSRAAKIVGASRYEMQRKIRKGQLITFEGQVSEQALKKAYPEVRIEDNSQIERLQRIQARALDKSLVETVSDTEILKMEILRLRHVLNQTKEELLTHHRMIGELKDRLLNMQSDCTKRQKLMLQALLSWMRMQTGQEKHL